jgi:hypothetical protein
MAIAPFEETKGRELDPSGRLRLIEGGRPATAPRRGTAVHARPGAPELAGSRAAHPSAQRVQLDPRTQGFRAPVQVTARTRAARRRAAAIGIALVAAVVLALPVRALGAMTLNGQEAPGGVPSGLAPGASYIVQSGDTERSIANMVNPADASTIARELATATGSTTLVPGEKVVIP